MASSKEGTLAFQLGGVRVDNPRRAVKTGELTGLFESSENPAVKTLPSAEGLRQTDQEEDVQDVAGHMEQMIQAVIDLHEIEDLQEKIKEMESKCELMKAEKRHAESLLEKERERRFQAQLKADSRMKEQEAKIAELEKELALRFAESENVENIFKSPANKPPTPGDAGGESDLYTTSFSLRHDALSHGRPMPNPCFSLNNTRVNVFRGPSSSPCNLREPSSSSGVPIWRIVEIDDLDESDEDTPIDDMSEEAYIKRHEELKAKEKERNRKYKQRP